MKLKFLLVGIISSCLSVLTSLEILGFDDFFIRRKPSKEDKIRNIPKRLKNKTFR